MSQTQTPGRDYVPPTRALLIDGRMVPGEGEAIEVVNPATEEILATVQGTSLA